ncbi:MAG TPA: hypothetical protein VHR86_03050 [Armatimonadota bacterium]|nr:hypothetical protein [Armatimonadota bacterium]
MAKTSVRLEGGRGGEPDTIHLKNDRLAATLQRLEGSYHLTSLSAGGEYELLAKPSPLLSYYDGKEHHTVPFTAVAVEEEGSDTVRLCFTAQVETLHITLNLSLNGCLPFLELDADCQTSAAWQGLVYFSCFTKSDFIPTAYPWIAGTTVTDRGFVYGRCMGAPLLLGDPRGFEGHSLAAGFPLSTDYRDLFFHYDPSQCRITAGIGADGVPAPAAPPEPAAEETEEPHGLLRWLLAPAESEETEETEPSLDLCVSYRAGVHYHLPLQLWALTGEHRHFVGEWLKRSNFSFDNPQVRPVEESLQMTLQFLKEGAPFLEGAGYPLRSRRDAREPGQGIGGYLHLYGNAALATALYRCWQRFGESWMHDRAIVIADFIVDSTRSSGKIPEAYDPQTGAWCSLGKSTHYDGAGLCIESMLSLYEMRRASERKDDVRLRRTATNFLQMLLDERYQRMEKERRQGKRRHDQETTFPYSGDQQDEAANPNMMIVLEHMRRNTNAHRIEVVRQDAEKWVLHNVVQHMSWRDGDPLLRGMETRSLLRFIEYAIQRRNTTYGKRYQDMAESLTSYFFLTLIPKDLEWMEGRTKGLQIANANRRALTVAYADCVTPVAALHRLGKLCNDRFYAQLGDYLMQVAMLAQCDEDGIPGYGGWVPELFAPDAAAPAIPPCDGELCVTAITPAGLETYLYLTEKK